MDRAASRPHVGAWLWVVATLVGVPAGVAVLKASAPELRWMGLTFPIVMFAFQYLALALAGRHRPLLLLLGVGLVLSGAFCFREVLPRSWSQGVRFGIYGVFFGVAWAGALARSGKQVVLWIVVGVIALPMGFWFSDHVHRLTRSAIDAPDLRQVVPGLALGLILALATTPLVWASLRSRLEPERDEPRPRLGEGALSGGRVNLVLAGLYLLILGGWALYGAVEAGKAEPAQRDFFRTSSVASDRAAYPNNALDLGALNCVLAGACILVGLGLLARVNAARHAFQVVAPAGALAFASIFAHEYWRADLPKTMLLGLPFGLLVFALGRSGTIGAATLRPDGTSAPATTITRGLSWAFGLLAAAFLVYFVMKGNKPVGRRGFGARGYANHLDALNEYVKRLAVVYVFLWHAIPGLLAAAIPTFLRRRA